MWWILWWLHSPMADSKSNLLAISCYVNNCVCVVFVYQQILRYLLDDETSWENIEYSCWQWRQQTWWRVSFSCDGWQKWLLACIELVCVWCLVILGSVFGAFWFHFQGRAWMTWATCCARMIWHQVLGRQAWWGCCSHLASSGRSVTVLSSEQEK